MFAEAIHKASNRSKYPFVEINCSAIPENLLESELFGYAPGHLQVPDLKGKKRKFEEAHNGTLFLDEIGDISLNTQVKLLRFTQEKYIEKLGDTKKIPVNVRIISATNRNLEQMVRRVNFEPIYFTKLKCSPNFYSTVKRKIYRYIHSCLSFLNHYAKKYNKSIMLTPDAVECLQDYPWPGNVRELKNVIEHAVILCQTNKITRDDLQLNVLDTSCKT